MSFIPRLARTTAVAARVAAAATRSRLAAALLLAPLAASAPLPATPASAAIDPGSYHHVDVIKEYPAPYGEVGGNIACPAGMKAVASGATSSGLHDIVTANLTTFDGNGVFVTALGNSGGWLQASARCVDAAQLQGSTLATTTIRDHRPAMYSHVGRATCPAGTIAYGGGVSTSPPGPLIVVQASMPSDNGTAWLVATSGSLYPGIELSISAHCFPRSQFGGVLTVTETDTTPPQTQFQYPYATLSAAAHCPPGYSAYAGGASLHRPGSSPPEFVGDLSASTMTAGDGGWFARGWTSAQAQLTTTVQCMTRPINRPRVAPIPPQSRRSGDTATASRDERASR